MERSGTNALGVRRPVSAAAPRCKAPAGRGLSARATGGRGIAVRYRSLRQRYALPPPSQREARGNGFPRQCAHWLGMTGERGGQGRPSLQSGTRAARKRDVEDAVPLRSDRGTGWTGSSAPTERNKSCAETGRRGRRPLRAALRVHVHKGMRIPTPVTRSLALIDILFGKTEPRGVRRGALFVYAYTQFSCTGSSGFCSTVTRISPVRWLSTRVTCTRSP